MRRPARREKGRTFVIVMTNNTIRPTRDQMIEAGFVSPATRPDRRPPESPKQPPKAPSPKSPRGGSDVSFTAPLRRYWENLFGRKR
jgi:hypothetical protein